MIKIPDRDDIDELVKRELEEFATELKDILKKQAPRSASMIRYSDIEFEINRILEERMDYMYTIDGIDY